MNLRPLLRATDLDVSQRLLLVTLWSLSSETEQGPWASVSRRELVRLLGACRVSIGYDLAALREREAIGRAARLADGGFLPGWYLDVRYTGRVSFTAVACPVERTRVLPVDLPSVPPDARPAPRTWDEPTALAAAATGSEPAANWLARRHFAAAERIAKKLGDVEAAGEALTLAIMTFDPARSSGFGTHLHWCVRSIVRDAKRRYWRDPASSPLWDREGERLDPDALDAGLDPLAEIAAQRERDRLTSAGGAVAVALLEGQSAGETAAQLGQSVHAIRRERTRVRALARET